jgi:hypothetical protein
LKFQQLLNCSESIVIGEGGGIRLARGGTGGALRLCIGGGCLNSQVVTIGQWVHVVGTWDPYNRLKNPLGGGRYLYVNHVDTFEATNDVVEDKPFFFVGT